MTGAGFYITLGPQPLFDKKFVACGRVVAGLRTVKLITKMEAINERPKLQVTISESGDVLGRDRSVQTPRIKIDLDM